MCASAAAGFLVDVPVAQQAIRPDWRRPIHVVATRSISSIADATGSAKRAAQRVCNFGLLGEVGGSTHRTQRRWVWRGSTCSFIETG